jgi:hypothetical protein
VLRTQRLDRHIPLRLAQDAHELFFTESGLHFVPSGVPDRDAFEVVFGKGLLGAGAPSVEEWGWDFQKQLLALSRDL